MDKTRTKASEFAVARLSTISLMHGDRSLLQEKIHFNPIVDVE